MILFLMSGFCLAQPKQDLGYYFYCNQTENLSKVWIINSNYALGVRMQEKPKWFVKDIVLINGSNLIIDSLSLVKHYNVPSGNYISVNNFFKKNENEVYIMHGHGGLIISIEDDKIHIVEEISRTVPRESEDFFKGNMELLTEATFRYGNYLIGYERKKYDKRNEGISKKDKENFPNFWVVDLADPSKIIINPKDKNIAVTKDLFFPLGNLDYVDNKTEAFKYFINIYDDKVFFNVARANTFYVFDMVTKEVSSFPFQYIEDGQSNFLYIDNSLGKKYVVTHMNKKTYRFHTLSDDYQQMLFVGELNEFPTAIVDGRVHVIREEKENNRQFNCHFLIPLDTSNVDYQILEEIIINGNE